MATKTDPNKIEYLVLSKEARLNILREQLSLRETEHFRLHTAFAEGEDPSGRLAALTEAVKALQAEIKALEG